MRQKLFIILLAFISINFHSAAQNRSASGIVIDSLTNKPMEYIAVYFKGTSTGCLTNYNGEFYLADNSGVNTLVVEAVGYEKKFITLKPGKNENLTILLKQERLEIASAVVKPKREKYRKKDNPAVELIKNVIANKDKNRIEDKEYYSCDLYEKLTLSLEDYHPDFEKKKKQEYLRQYIDTSEVTGKPILTFSIRENMCDYYYRRSPHQEKTIRKATKHIGFDKEFDHNGGLTSTLELIFTGVDIFDNEITFIANRFVSPISSTLGTMYYKYYIMDTVKVDNIPCIDLAFVPYNSESFGFTGRLYITNDGKYSIKKVQMNFPSNSNVNWIDKLRIDQEFQLTDEGLWALKREDSYVNLAVVEGTQGVFAHQTRAFNNHNTDESRLKGHKAYSIDGPLEILPDAKKVDDSYWEQNRLVPLNKRESTVAQASKEITEKSSMTFWMKVMDAIVSEYVPTSGSKSTSKFDFGSVFAVAGYNHIEKARFRIGGMTTANLSKRWFASGYLAYGTNDQKFKYNIKLTHSFNDKHYHPDERPLNNLSVSYTYDIFSPEILTDQHGILTSLKAAQPTKLQYIRKANIQYDKQWSNSFRSSFWFEHDHYTPATLENDPRTLRYEVMNPNGLTTRIPSLTTAEFGVSLRWAPGEKAMNMVSQRANIDKDTPIFTLSHRLGIKGLLGGEYNYNRTDLNIFKRFRLSVAGFLDARIAAGGVWNQVPWPLLVIAEANQSFSYRRESFHMLNALEFISDRSVQMNLTWHMKGLFFNRVPLLKKLNLREVLVFNGLYGTLSDQNNPMVTPGLFMIPEGTRPLGNMPYMEVGVGLENIFKLLRIVYFQRITYRDANLSWMSKWGGLRFGIYVDF